jgi:hypothetical protein
MHEDFLHYLWRMKRFDFTDLRTTQGDSIELLDGGTPNGDAGPDFTQARIRIAGTLWVGNVEMHLRSSDWLRHAHQEDPAYENVILHVVFEEDQPIYYRDGARIPCLELRGRTPARLRGLYQALRHGAHWIPCAPQYSETPELTRQLWLDRLLVERLERKTAAIAARIERLRGDWEEAFYQHLARSFGLQVNAEPFDQLAVALPISVLRRYQSSLFQMEALLFGQAGLLDEDFQDDYPRRLKQEAQHLINKHQLNPFPAVIWKFSRLRPANFPSLRIAQFATLIYQSGHLFSKMLTAKNSKEIEHMFEVRLSNYWKDHYRFDRRSKRATKTLGEDSIHHIIINTIAPFLFLYGKERQEFDLQDRALHLLEELPPENNAVVRKWHELGQSAQSAYESQALLQLKNEYCTRQRCLYCAVGSSILR